MINVQFDGVTSYVKNLIKKSLELSYKNLYNIIIMSDDIYCNFNELPIKTQMNILKTVIKLSKEDETFKEIYQKLLNESSITDNYIFTDDITSC